MFFKEHTGRASIKYKIVILFLFILIFAAAIRIYALFYNEAILEGDEAIVGLMAKHICANIARPVFVYGQDYMGSLEAYTAAALFILFGENVYSLKSASAIYSLLICVAVYILIKNIYGLRWALLMTLFAAAPPYLFLLWGLSPTGGHIENAAFAVVLLIIIEKFFNDFSRKNIFILSVIAGVAFWVNPFSIFILIAFIITVLSSARNRSNFKLTIAVTIGIFILFWLGCLPLVIYNFKHHFITFKKLAGFFLGISQITYSNNTGLFSLLISKFLIMLAAIPRGFVGLINNFTKELGNFYIDGLFFLICAGYLTIKELFGRNLIFKTTAIYIVIITLIMSVSSRASRPRYLLIYYPALMIAIPYFINELTKKINCVSSRKLIFVRYLATLVIGCLIIVNTNKILSAARRETIDAFYLKYENTINFLKSRNIKYVYADMYIAYPLTFLSNERIIVSPAAGFYNEDRIKEYTIAAAANKTNTFIFYKDSYSARTLNSKLKEFNVNFQKIVISDLEIFYDFDKYIPVNRLDLPKRFKKTGGIQ